MKPKKQKQAEALERLRRSAEAEKTHISHCHMMKGMRKKENPKAALDWAQSADRSQKRLSRIEREIQILKRKLA